MKNEITKEVLLKAGFKKFGKETERTWDNSGKYTHCKLVYRKGKFVADSKTYYEDDITIHLTNITSSDGTEDNRVNIKIQKWLKFNCETSIVTEIEPLARLLSVAGYADLTFDLLKQVKP